MNIKIRPCVETLLPYNPGKPVEELERELGITNIIKLASNENPLGPSPKAVLAMQKVATEMNYYPDGSGYNLRAKIAKIHGVDADEISLGNGSDEIVGLITQMLIEPGDETIISELAFVRYEMATQAMGGKSVIVPAKNKYGHDLAAMKKSITPKTKIIFVCNPNNPTGTIVTQQEIDEFMTGIPENVLVVFDEAYYEFVSNPSYAQTLKYQKDGRNVMILRTFSKIYGLAGLRIGYAITSKEWVTNFNRIRPPFNVNRMAMFAAEASLDDQDHVVNSHNLNKEGKTYFYTEFKKMNIPYVETEGNFILIDTKQDGRVVYQKLLEQGVIIRPMGMYKLPTHIRITMGTMPQNQRFIECFRKLVL